MLKKIFFKAENLPFTKLLEPLVSLFDLYIAMVWMFVSPQNSYIEILTLKGGKMWSLWEVLVMRIELQRTPTLFHHVRAQQEGISYEPERGPSLEGDHAATLILDFPASRTLKAINFCHYKPLSILLQQSKQTKRHTYTQNKNP